MGDWSGAVAVLQIRHWMAAASSGRRRKEIGWSWLDNGLKRRIIIIIISTTGQKTLV